MTEIYPIIGMSPGNSYFKDDVVKDLVKAVVEKWGKAAVLIADIPAISTYMALGYPENRAWRDKALPQGNALRNRVQRACESLGYTSQQVRVVDWENEVEKNPLYIEKYKEVSKLYETSPQFKDVVHGTTRSVLEYSGKNLFDIDQATKVASEYLLSELAFMEYAPEFLKTNKAVYIYHKDWPVYEQYIAGAFDGKPKESLGFEIVAS